MDKQSATLLYLCHQKACKDKGYSHQGYQIRDISSQDFDFMHRYCEKEAPIIVQYYDNIHYVLGYEQMLMAMLNYSSSQEAEGVIY